MSSETRPVSPNSFAQAIEDLPAETLYSKAHEINNSIAHLEQSNKLLQEYSDSIKNDENIDAQTRAGGDKDCLDAIRENKIVIDRQRDRVRLLKAEVERRGQRWHEADPDAKPDVSNGGAQSATTNGGIQAASAQAQPRLTDDELRRQLEARLPDVGNDEDGMHL